MRDERAPDLFSYRPPRPRRRYPDSPGHRGVATQVAAAKRVAPRANSMRGRILAHLIEKGEHGATREEIAAALDMKLQTVCGRVRELAIDDKIYEAGKIRNCCQVMVART
jgi:hypothetical protein